jgi:predicted GNAT family N-acyltransferase
MTLLTEHLNHQHKRNDFSCSNLLLDNYLKYQAGQDARKKLSACFVLSDPSSNQIKGYYTLSNSSLPSEVFPEKFRLHLPGSYISIPTTLLGRLAVDKTQQGKGTGKLLLIDALRRSYLVSNTIGSFAVVVDAVSEEAGQFYNKYGFIRLPDSGKLFIPMKTVRQLFER